ncbi:MAG: InlB B-repeat-containing protein, partial [Sphaerochaetaceae bacterium]|nr:InlB B-repeat-containing protein [Sphaerochaetaceae bacterium]
YEENGGSSVTDTTDVRYGAKISAPTAPTKIGYSFEGWYTDTGLTSSWDFSSDTVTEATTLYAKWRELRVGDLGPAGGYIFYDDTVGFDFNYDSTIASDEKDLLDGTNDGTVRGDRYLEAAPADVVLDGSDYTHIFGYYRTASNGASTLVGAATGVGTGKTNTGDLVSSMGTTAYISNATSTTTTTEDYAALLCDIHEAEGYSDWFLPSMDELNLMYHNLKEKKLGGFSDSYFWSSSERSANDAWFQYFFSGYQGSYGRNHEYRVRPVRAF